jgi:hypothetical protein
MIAEGIAIGELVERGIKTLTDPHTEVQISKMERTFLIKHADSFFYRLGNNETGIIKLSQWWACWSVKWYSNDDGRQIVLLDGVGEKQAREYFYSLKKRSYS